MEKYYIKLSNAILSNEFYNFKDGGQGGNGLKGKDYHYFGKVPPNVNTKTIICENIKTHEIIEFDNITQFTKKNNFMPSKIVLMLQGKRSSHKGYWFYYKGDIITNKIYKDTTPIVAENLITKEKIVITNISEYCRNYNVAKSSIFKCLNGIHYQNKNFIYYRCDQEKPNPPIKKLYKAINLESNQEFVFEDIKAFCKIYNLTYSRVTMCLTGTQKSRIHKNFKFEIIGDKDNPERSLCVTA